MAKIEFERLSERLVYECFIEGTKRNDEELIASTLELMDDLLKSEFLHKAVKDNNVRAIDILIDNIGVNEDNIEIFEDEDGEEVLIEVIDKITIDDKEYLVVHPLDYCFRGVAIVKKDKDIYSEVKDEKELVMVYDKHSFVWEEYANRVDPDNSLITEAIKHSSLKTLEDLLDELVLRDGGKKELDVALQMIDEEEGVEKLDLLISKGADITVFKVLEKYCEVIKTFEFKNTNLTTKGKQILLNLLKEIC